MLMKTLDKLVKTLLLVIAAQACSTPYYGYTKRDWDRLSVEEQSTVKNEYQAIVGLKREQVHKDALDARTQSIVEYGVGGPKYGQLQ